MNSKAEWNQPLVPRVVVTQELKELDSMLGPGREGREGQEEGEEEGQGDRGAEAEPKTPF